MTITFAQEEIQQTINMIHKENLDIRTITMGISLLDCSSEDIAKMEKNIYDKITKNAGRLVTVGEQISARYGIPIINKRVSVTPIAIAAAQMNSEEMVRIAKVLNKAAREIGINFIGGFSSLVQKGFTAGDRALIDSIPQALSETEFVCSSVNIGSTKAGINMDAVLKMGKVILESAQLTADSDGIAAAKLVVFCNAPEDNPFMAGAFHGVGEPDCVINVGVSGPGVVAKVVKEYPEADFSELSNLIKQTSFKITRMGELIGRAASKSLSVPFGIVDLSLAPTPAIGDSVAEILENMGLERCGTHGTTAALALLNDAVKKGGAMASSHVGGLSGAFIPVSEDAGMVRAVEEGALTLDKLEAMTCVCSVGLDMIALPGDVSSETISAIIADEAAIGMINKKTTAVRVIPAIGKKAGDRVEFGGLLGGAPVIAIHPYSSNMFVRRGGRIPAPIISLTN
ncbi:PFL family protein [Desulfosporosinus sp.]|uniref:PFL family protein n=1 Tax=Desulfosporosinus sp. TaxID=157907 RepID=UPI0025C0A7A7|nr:PFL family protein [Desulfosporosinus sp.]MBC2724458.1 PFL family protein [Desulfosporosinus sp.]MBC2725893.1 PFL family protein [Desulfosporosinus sp.]